MVISGPGDAESKEKEAVGEGRKRAARSESSREGEGEKECTELYVKSCIPFTTSVGENQWRLLFRKAETWWVTEVLV